MIHKLVVLSNEHSLLSPVSDPVALIASLLKGSALVSKVGFRPIYLVNLQSSSDGHYVGSDTIPQGGLRETLTGVLSLVAWLVDIPASQCFSRIEPGRGVPAGIISPLGLGRGFPSVS